MTITVDVDWRKCKSSNFNELTNETFAAATQFGRNLLRGILEARDDELREHRDKKRYRNKGKRRTCVKTKLGAIEYERTVYEDMAVSEAPRCVFLLDEELDIDLIGNVALDVCEEIAKSVCEMPYRVAAAMLTENTGLSISPQGVWNISQKLGSQRDEQVERMSALAKGGKGAGRIETELLYEEDDGIWLSLQGPDRKEHGPSKEMKVGIAYTGALWSGGKSGKARRTLSDKVAYAAIDTVDSYRQHKEGVVAGRFNMKKVKLRICNGDGAGWVQGFGKADINVLDAFHRNRAILTHVQSGGYRKLLMKQLYEPNIPMLMACIEAMENSTDNPKEQEHYRTLYTYFKSNEDGLLGVYDRGVKIPDTRKPGVIHHARLGSMESNVFTLIGNRMKGRRCNWSIRGANNLANLLCMYHMTGFEGMFAGTAAKEAIPMADEFRSPIGAGRIPRTVGRGYECRSRTSVPPIPWLKGMTGYQPLTSLHLT